MSRAGDVYVKGSRLVGAVEGRSVGFMFSSERYVIFAPFGGSRKVSLCVASRQVTGVRTLPCCVV